MSESSQALSQQLSDRHLNEFIPSVQQLVQAFESYPDMDDCDRPERQVTKFLRNSEDLPQEERAVRFKHLLSHLSAFTCRACGRSEDGSLTYFNPLEQTYGEFAKSVSNIETYQTVTAFPAQDVVLKTIQHAARMNVLER